MTNSNSATIAQDTLGADYLLGGSVITARSEYFNRVASTDFDYDIVTAHKTLCAVQCSILNMDDSPYEPKTEDQTESGGNYLTMSAANVLTYKVDASLGYKFEGKIQCSNNKNIKTVNLIKVTQDTKCKKSFTERAIEDATFAYSATNAFVSQGLVSEDSMGNCPITKCTAMRKTTGLLAQWAKYDTT